MNLQDHPIASIFPLLSQAELSDLAHDIQANGLKEPICLHEGKILDGRNRYRACQIVGVTPPVRKFCGNSPTSFVVSKNLKRRHLTPSQAAAVAVDTLPFFEQEAKERQGTRTDITAKLPESSTGEAREKAAEQVGASPRYVSDAKAVKTKAPQLFEAVKQGEKTLSEAKREIKKQEHQAKVAAAQAAPPKREITGPFDLVLADPPWRYDFSETSAREIENQYPTATVEQICAHKPAAKPDSVLFLWATAPKLREALRVMEAWGFDYKTHAIWDKEKPGMGYWFRGQHELLLVGTRGKFSPPPECERIASVIRARRGTHSAKPEAVSAWLERAFPGTAKLEMYCRTPRGGWAVWGNET